MRGRMWSFAPLALGVVLLCDLTAGAAEPVGSAGQAGAAAPVVPGQGLTPSQDPAEPAVGPGTGASLQALTDSVRFEAHAVTTGDVPHVLALLAASCRPRQRAAIAESVRSRGKLTPGPQPASDLVVVGAPGRRRAVHYEVGTRDGTWSADEYWTAASGNWRRLCGRGPGSAPS